MPWINCKIHLKLNWDEYCILSSAGDFAKLKITDAKAHVPIVTLSTKGNVNLTKQLSSRFKRYFHWNNYQTIPTKIANQRTNIHELVRASFQDFKRLFLLLYAIAGNAANNKTGIKDNKKHFLLRRKIENYNVLTDGRSFHDQPINDLIKQYKEVRKVLTGQGDDYAIRCLLDYAYFKNNYILLAVDTREQKALDDDPRAIQQISISNCC